MFWNNFIDLCLKNNTKPNPVAKELGISSGAVSKWKSGTMPNSITLRKIADYFGVSPDYLLLDRDTQKKGDAIADIILDLRSNSDLLDVVQNLRTLSPDDLKAVNLFITTFKK